MNPRLIVWVALMLFVSPTALAGVVVTGVVPGDGLSPRAALHEQGVTFPVDGEEPLLACSTMAGGVDMQGVVWTGDERFLAYGHDGPWLTDTDGCHWVATFGPVSERRIVAAYQSEPGSKRVLFAASGDLGVTGVMVSEDGGYTNEVLAGLSFGELELVGLAGNGDQVGILGQDPDGALRGGVSDDGGVNFTER
ncbi:MAG: hypothetical protein VX938_04405, partial [Myxococcota bacterium]|nr:hypothetical protein [Myxococcota bacterium]